MRYRDFYICSCLEVFLNNLEKTHKIKRLDSDESFSQIKLIDLLLLIVYWRLTQVIILMLLDLKNPTNFKMLLLLNLGILHALKNKIITIEEAEIMLYSPHMMNLLIENKIRQELINIIHLGTELEDVTALNLDLNLAIEKMIAISEEALTKCADIAGEQRWYVD